MSIVTGSVVGVTTAAKMAAMKMTIAAALRQLFWCYPS